MDDLQDVNHTTRELPQMQDEMRAAVLSAVAAGSSGRSPFLHASKQFKASHPPKMPDKAFGNEVGFMGGPISPTEFYTTKSANSPPVEKLHGFLVQACGRSSACSWYWGSQPRTVGHGSLLGPLLLPSGDDGDDHPVCGFWTNGPDVRPNKGELRPGNNLLVISQDTFDHILRESTSENTDPFPEHTTIGTSIHISMLARMADRSLDVQHVQAFVIPNIFAHALANLPK